MTPNSYEERKTAARERRRAMTRDAQDIGRIPSIVTETLADTAPASGNDSTDVSEPRR